jgi:hypothetical protein
MFSKQAWSVLSTDFTLVSSKDNSGFATEPPAADGQSERLNTICVPWLPPTRKNGKLQNELS